MAREDIKITDWRNRLLLSVVSYALYLIMWLILDDEIVDEVQEMTVVDCITDFLLCMFFTYISLGASCLIFKILQFRTSYTWRIVYASCLLILNNVIAFCMIPPTQFLMGEDGKRTC